MKKTEEFVFTNEYGTDNLYYGIRSREDNWQTELFLKVAFVTKKTVNPVSKYSFKEAWELSSGTIFILGKQPDAPNVFLEKIEHLNLSNAERLVWIPDPNLPFDEWTPGRFNLSASNLGVRKLNKEVRFTLSPGTENYALIFSKGCEFKVDSESPILSVTKIANDLGFGKGKAILPIDESGITVLLDGSTGPIFNFGFTIPEGEKLVEWFNLLDVGIRYSYLNENSELDSVRYPIFESHQQHNALTAQASLVPGNLLNKDVSYINTKVFAGGNGIYVSYFRTLDGRIATLKLGQEQLTFYFNRCGDKAFSLMPDGKFEIEISDQKTELDSDSIIPIKSHSFACGSSGTEFIELTNESSEKLYLKFKSGMPGFAVLGDSGDQPLSDRTTTSWLQLYSDSKNLNYCAQPQGEGTLYDATNPAGSPKVPLFYFLPLPSAQLDTGEISPIIPMVPLAGINVTHKVKAIQLENASISPCRKAIISKKEITDFRNGIRKPLLPAGTTFRNSIGDESMFDGVTPRGLLANFSKSDNVEKWVSVALAQLLDNSTDKNKNSGQLKLGGSQGIIEPLRSALLTNQQFIVATDSSTMSPFMNSSDAEITLKGWHFLLDPVEWDKHGTIMIIKNAALSLKELANDIGSWTLPNEFNHSPINVSKKLNDIIAKAEKEVDANRKLRKKLVGPNEGTVSDLEFFVDVVVRSPEWNGCLFLNVNLGLIPTDLAAMEAGIKINKFYAHHLGVTQTPFRSLKELIETSSSMFGLINYEDTSSGFGIGYSYDFRAEYIGVLFQDSQVKSFNAKIAIYLPSLFGMSPNRTDDNSAVIRMNGIRHFRDGGDAYMFAATTLNEFGMGNGPLKKVKIVQAEFLTLTSDFENAIKIESQFVFAGSLEFETVNNDEKPMDLFSFDDLAFSKLILNMNYLNSDPKKLFFEFSIENLICDEAMSVSRKNSLYAGFPAKLGKIIGNQGKSVGALGFMTVELPAPVDELPKSWYGVVLNLDLGSMSDNAGAIGLQANLILAWGNTASQYFVGLEITGYGLSGSGSELSLLGILKLKMYSISIRNSESNWALMLHGMKLGVFGKTLPTSGSFDFYLFGDPVSQGGIRNFGWYGAYSQDKKEDSKKTSLAYLSKLKLNKPENQEIILHDITNKIPTKTRRTKNRVIQN